MAAPCSIVVLISGNGSNLQALIDQRAQKGFAISAVISNEPDAYGLQRAAQAGIPAEVLNHRDFPTRETFDQQLMQRIDAYAPQLLVLAGYMRILSADFVQHYHGRILNIHPSLLPDYRGTNTHQRVLDAGEPMHGVSVHFVTEELDGGPVILQTELPVTRQDTADTLRRRIAEQEHRMYPEVVGWYCSGRLEMKDNGAWLDDTRLPPQGLRRSAF